MALTGVTSIDTRGKKERIVELVIVPDVAVMVIVPELVSSEVTSPVSFTVAIPESEEPQVTSVSLRVVLFENLPIASSCKIVPGAMLGVDGVIARETSVVDEATSILSTLQPGIKTGIRITRMMKIIDRNPLIIVAIL